MQQKYEIATSRGKFDFEKWRNHVKVWDFQEQPASISRYYKLEDGYAPASEKFFGSLLVKFWQNNLFLAMRLLRRTISTKLVWFFFNEDDFKNWPDFEENSIPTSQLPNLIEFIAPWTFTELSYGQKKRIHSNLKYWTLPGHRNCSGTDIRSSGLIVQQFVQNCTTDSFLFENQIRKT